MDHFNFSMKKCFIFDPTLKSKKKKPNEDEQQDVKLLYYYPANEDTIIKRSNTGIIEGSISFLDAFEKSNDNFIIADLSQSFYIANKMEDDIYVVLFLHKSAPININGSSSTLQNLQQENYIQTHDDVETKRKWFQVLLNNFYNTFILYNGLIKKMFFTTNSEGVKLDARDDDNTYKDVYSIISDFLESYFEGLSAGTRLPFLDSVLYFPLNEVSYSQVLLASQRLIEKIPETKYSTIIYKGYLMHNELPINTMSLIYNSLYSNIDSSPKYHNFTMPPHRVVQTVYSGIEDYNHFSVSNSNFRKGYGIVGNSSYLVGLSNMNINNFRVFIPNIYIKETGETVKMLIYSHYNMLVLLFLNANFNVANKINTLIKLENWIKRYFDEDMPLLENLYVQKNNKLDNYSFAYVNNANKSIKLSTSFFNKKNKIVEKDRINTLFNVFKFNYMVDHVSLMKLKGYLMYYIKTCDRKVIIALPDTISISMLKLTIEEIKKDLFDYIFIL